MIAVGGGRKSRPKKSNLRSWFFRPWFSSPNSPSPLPHCNRRTLEFAILCLWPTFLRKLKIFLNVWRIRNIANSRVLRLWWGGGVVVGDENYSWKYQRLRSWPVFLWRLLTFSQTEWRSRSVSFDMIKLLGLSSTSGFLSCSTRLLSQATPQI